MQDELQAILENPCVLTILNNMPQYVYIVDEQGCLQFINPAVEAFENLTNSEVEENISRSSILREKARH